jgi:hypothetical protein
MEIMIAAQPRWEEFLAQLDRNLPDQQKSYGHNFAISHRRIERCETLIWSCGRSF